MDEQNKRKYKELTIVKKNEIYKKLENGQSVKSLAIEYEVSEKTVYNIKKTGKQSVSIDPERKRKGSLKFRKTDDALFKWYQRQQAQGISMTDEMLKKTAIKFSRKLNETCFIASKGWLTSFQQRHNITSQVAVNENISVDESGIEDFNVVLEQMLDDKDETLLEELYDPDEPESYPGVKNMNEETFFECHGCSEVISNPEASSELIDTFLELIGIEPSINGDAPVFCKQCKLSLESFRSFKKLCLVTQELLSYRNSNEEIEIPMDYVENVVIIKSEPTTIEDEGTSAEPLSKIESNVVEDGRSTKESECYVCDLCQKEIKTRKALLVHMRNFHLGNTNEQEFPTITCHFENCALQFSNKTMYWRHVREHEGKNELCVCEFCGRKFATYQNMKRHQPSHNTDENLKCSYCDSRYKNRANLGRHEKYVHEKERGFMCEECGFMTFHPSSMRQHKLMQHSNKRYKCEQCSKEFKVHYYLKIHMLTHRKDLERNVPCPHCDSLFKHKLSLRDHIRNAHMKPRHFKCGTCDKKFKSNTKLERHEQIHDQSRKYKCEFCNLAFTQNHVLKRHLTIHTGEKPFGCQYCGQRFVENYYCKLHTKSCAEKPTNVKETQDNDSDY